MFEVKEVIYAQMVEHQRTRHDLHSSGWPGKGSGEPAVTVYPNILAELDSSGFWLERMGEFGGTSRAIMAAVVEDGEELSEQELDGLTRCFGCKLSYLAAPTMQMVDPATNKGKYRRHLLESLDTQTVGMDSAYRFKYDFACQNVLTALKNGKPVTYAAYRWAMHHLQEALDCENRKIKRLSRERRERRSRSTVA